MNHKTGLSQRSLAGRFNCSQAYISKTLATGYSNPIKCRKRVKTPYYASAEKINSTKTKCRKLYNHTAGKMIMMYDEKYFRLTGYQTSGNIHFYSSDPTQTPTEVKNRAKSKFEPKLLLWIAISEDGISSPTILTSETGMSINTDVYISKCLRPNLLPFFARKTNHIFWPDLASAHYSTKNLEFLNTSNVNFVPKAINPPNVPQCRPIEDFFGALATKVYAGNWVDKDTLALVARIRRCVSEFPLQVVHDMMTTSRTKLRNTYKHGISSSCH